MHDLVIRNGLVVDGSGGPAHIADVAVTAGVITAVEPHVDGPARQTLDADGRLVMPGFVDIHTHYDAQASWDPWLTPSSWHGVTTVVMGNCGVGFAPARPDRQPPRAGQPGRRRCPAGTPARSRGSRRARRRAPGGATGGGHDVYGPLA